MKYYLSILALAISSTSAPADQRVLSTPLPSWCQGISTGACVPGAKDYVLVDGQVHWVDKNNPNDKRFWQIQDADKFGTNNAGSTGGSGEAQ